MTFTNIGYAGTVTDVGWAQLIPWAGGSEYCIPDADSFRANSAPGDRNVDISPGTAAGHGVLVESDSSVTINLPSVSSGSRWDLIALRRIWGTATSSVVRVAGGAAKAIPSILHNPGVEDFQPLWLLRVAAGQTTIQEFCDLRAFVGNGGAWGRDDLVRSYLTRVGTVITIGTVRWERRIDALGSAVWIRAGTGVGNYTPPQTTRITFIESGSGVNLSSSTDTQVLKLGVTIAEAGLVDIHARLWWHSDGFNSAGTFRLKYGAVNGTEVARFRSHNNASGSDVPVFVALFARVALPAGITNFYLTGQRESAGNDIDVDDCSLSAWATS